MAKFSPSEVAHIWAQGELKDGTARESGGGMYGSGGNVSAYFEGPILYSYGSHFVTGVRIRGPRDGGGLAFVTDESSTMTTNRRVGDAWAAVSHYAGRHRLPTIPKEFAYDLRAIAGGATTVRGYVNGQWGDIPVKGRVADYLAQHAAWFASQPYRMDSAEALGAAAGMTAASVKRAIQAGCMAAAKADAKREKEERAAKLAKVRHIAGLSGRQFAEVLANLKDGAPNSWERQQADRSLKTYRALSRFASGEVKAGRLAKSTHEKLKARVRELDSYIDGMQERVALAARAKFEAEAREWLALESASQVAADDRSARGMARADAELWFIGRDALTPQPDTLAKWNPDLAAEVQNAKDARVGAWRAANFARWNRYRPNRDNRPDPREYPEGSAARAAIEADRAAERQELAKAYRAWDADPSQPRPAARLFQTAELAGLIGEGMRPFNRLAEAERQEKTAEAWRKWRAGEYVNPPARAMPDGSAYIRRTKDGENLETSQGASVPWTHAVRAFRFLKLCKERGETFARNGRTIRVGHYQVDRINADGSFVAGCHRFAWSEIERLAMAEGVFDLDADASAVESSH